jgi:ubiquitin-protein ligase
MIRLRRLTSDLNKINELVDKNNGIISFKCDGNPPDKYIFEVKCNGIIGLTGKKPKIAKKHKFEVYLHTDYPRRPPHVKMLSPIFHPNMLSPEENGGVCLGDWAPAQSLDLFVAQIVDMIQYKNYSASVSSALDLFAAEWANSNQELFPVGNKEFLF